MERFMIGKQFKARNFDGCVAYVLGKEGARLIGSNVGSENKSEITAKFLHVSQYNPRVTRPVYHCSLSLPIGEQLPDDKWRSITEEYLLRMGFKANHYILVRHTDRPHDHCHIVANRVGIDGSCVSDSWDYHRSEMVLRGIEAQYQLVTQSPSWECGQRRPSRRQSKKKTLIGQELVKTKLQALLSKLFNQYASETNDWQKITDALVQNGVKAHIYYEGKSGKPYGLSYQYGNFVFSGGQLGSEFLFTRVNKMFTIDQVKSPSQVLLELNLMKIDLCLAIFASKRFEDFQEIIQSHNISIYTKTNKHTSLTLTRNEVTFRDHDLPELFHHSNLVSTINRLSECYPFENPLKVNMIEPLYNHLVSSISEATGNPIPNQTEIDLTIAKYLLRLDKPLHLKLLYFSPNVKILMNQRGRDAAIFYLNQIITFARTDLNPSISSDNSRNLSR
jgi:hypothetical protein